MDNIDNIQEQLDDVIERAFYLKKEIKKMKESMINI